MGTLSLSGGTVVTSDARRTILPRATVVIRDGVVEAVLEKEARAERTIDCRGRLVLPGLVNLHAHTGESLFRGAGGDLGLVDWIERVSHLSMPMDATLLAIALSLCLPMFGSAALPLVRAMRADPASLY